MKNATIIFSPVKKELAYLEDILFEEMPNDKDKLWPERFLKAIKPGADLSLILPKFFVWQFEDSKVGLITLKEVTDDKEVLGFCKEVVALYKKTIDGEKVSENEFYELYLKIDRSFAWAEAWGWAWAGAGTWAWIWARAWAWTDYEKYILIQTDKLIELLEEAE